MLADGDIVQSVTLSDENEWTATVRNLPETNNAGKSIVYTWREEDVVGYAATVSRNGNMTEITNTHEPELTSVTVRKVWVDDNNATHQRPLKIVMKLSNGIQVALTEENHWQATVEDLPVYENGVRIEYTWTEVSAPGYVQTDVTVEGHVTTFTNELWTWPEVPEGYKPPKHPGTPIEVEIDEYGTPLGVEVIINHVGDCFD